MSSQRLLDRVAGFSAHKAAITSAISENDGQFLRDAQRVLDYRLGKCEVTAHAAPDGKGQAVLAVTVAIADDSKSAKDRAARISEGHFSARPLFAANHQYGRTRTTVTVTGPNPPA